jgi:nitroreductase
MIDAARWAPNSGNRQAWRFRIVDRSAAKELLKPVKEYHCTSAPILVYIGMDERVYGALGTKERSLYIDAGAATMQMVLVAHSANLGACWNHLSDDLLESRSANREAYAEFARHLRIPDFVRPIAIIALGRAAYVSPPPARTDVDRLLGEK